ncbi:hypothetical protein LTR64_002082 [Lithohypha guttulata]|uniref:uncharacterized protein n=1 Tax=Lithohypha guttulata TaxID=1690604 RepID=UPI002DDDCE17|nr:hypothetical protein LTR51_007940 [Lithohypha guttulata]
MVSGWLRNPSVGSSHTYISFFNPEPLSTLRSPKDIFPADHVTKDATHPIDNLITTSKTTLATLLKKQSHDVSVAASRYYERRGRRPPPHFDDWAEFALKRDCLLIEEFFDQIYRDIEPFWGLKAVDIRHAAATLPNTLRIRNGQVARPSKKWPFVNAYFDLLKVIEKHLPDVDIPVNEMDEPRVLLSWEHVDALLGQRNRSNTPFETPRVRTFGNLSDDKVTSTNHPWLAEGPFWPKAQTGCHPSTSGRSLAQDIDLSTPPQFPTSWPDSSYRGFVSNWTVATDPCTHADLRNLHGTFVQPISQAISTEVLPIFSGSKLAVNNDILLPSAVYWNDDKRFSTTRRISWEQKRDEVLWRGSASGGHNTANNWTRFQRHRLLSMLNGTQVQMAIEASQNGHDATDSREAVEKTPRGRHNLPGNFPLPNQSLYPLQSSALGLLPDWLRSISNAAFTWLVCFPATRDYACSYTGAWYRRGVEMPFYRMFKAKYLPDIDGNSFSGRFLAFLRSNSLPIKATIYKEWHDDRLVPWRHFVPMDNTFVDLWAILEYLVAHDDVAKEIASEGQKWADTVLRKEDMLVYVYRLILEYARVSDDRRDEMRWTPAASGVV